MAAGPATPLSSLDSRALNAVAMPSPTPTMQRLFHDPSERSGEELGAYSPLKRASFHEPNDVDENTTKQNQEPENSSRRKSRHSRVLSGNGLSPLKILAAQASETKSPEKSSPARSPKKWSPDKRFPVKVNNTTSPQKSLVNQREITLEDALAENKDLGEVVKIFEDEEDTVMENVDDDNHNNTYMSEEQEPEQDRAKHQIDLDDEDQAGADDTIISTFSTFSAVPNMTMFDRIGHTPTKFANTGATPTTRSRFDPSPQRTPRMSVRRESTNLLDFTEQIQNFSSRYTQQVSSLRGTSPGKSFTNSIAAATPQRRHANLIDFDIPPLPTPRSIPSITPRELETLKSGFLSEISSLKASLSGKEAEVSSLKTAVADAEKRVGESLEELREVKAIKEALVEEQQSWEKRGRDMESVLRKVKEEIVRGQRERDQLESKFEESEKRREAAEIMAQEAESKMAAMRAGKGSISSSDGAASDSSAAAAAKSSPEKSSKMPGSREVEIAVEKVSRELHSLYKSKHEAKIAALKKSYENRWCKKVQELESKIEELCEENEQLRAGRDATMTRVDANQSILDDERAERKDQAVRDSTQIRELDAEIQRLGAVVASVESDNRELRQLLEQERIEKGELVLLAEEMMAMQQQNLTVVVPKAEAIPPPTPAASSRIAASVTATPAAPPATTIARPELKGPEDFRSSVRGSLKGPEDFRSSVRGATGLRGPGSVKKPALSRIGGGGGLPRPGSGLGGSRSGIMSSIEKMGNYRGRGD